MVKVTITGTLVVLVKLPLMFPLPLLAIPVTETVLSLVQLYVVEETLPVIAIVAIVAPEQIVCEAFVAIAFGVGFTKTVAVTGVPGQPFAVGVMVKVTITGALVVLVKLPLMFPLPLLAIPVTETVLSLVQLYVVEETLPVIAIVAIVAPEQIVCEAFVAIAFGVGFTVNVAIADCLLGQV
jgi:hypothetical protein